MALCCNNCYPICQPFPSCPDDVFIFAPPGYDQEDIIVNIVKPGVNVNVRQLLTINPDGFVDLDATQIPEGFLNAFGGQYSIYFNDSVTNEPVPFIAIDGKEYDSICLSFISTFTNIETAQLIINVFNNEQPEL
jgi:hypothetical protein